jgi:hypothetical protein
MDTHPDHDDHLAQRGYPATRRDGGAAPPQQPRLPFEPLPFDDESERPIDLVLTARARRVVAPEALPRLRVVDEGDRTRGAAPAVGRAQVEGDTSPGEAEPFDPRDTRPARARALRRAGLSAADIASQLDVDVLLVEAWIDDVSTRGRRSRSGRRRSAAPRTAREKSPTDPAWGEARTLARGEAHARLATDASFALGLGLLAGCATVDTHAVTIRIGDAQRGSRLLTWLRASLGVPDNRIRVVLRFGPTVAGDLARHRWAKTLAVDIGAVALSRWAAPPATDAVEALIRIGEPTVTAQVAGWLDALAGEPSTDGLPVPSGADQPMSSGVGEPMSSGVGEPMSSGVGEAVSSGTSSPVPSGVGETGLGGP